MYKIFFSIITIIIVITTLCIYAFKPQMHKVVAIYNSDYKITETVTKVEKTTNLPTQTNTTKQVQKITTQQQETQKATSVNQVTQTKTKQTQVNQVPKTTTTTQKIDLPQSVQQIVKTQSAPVKTITSEEFQTQQEIILWNKWRSNIQNSIMNDVKLPIIQEGTIFKFSFDVDKYGKISNVKTWSLTPAYTPYAIQYIAPVIKSYQGRSILEFPTGSNRFSTTVTGGWKIAKTAKYSRPEDYQDTEKVNK